MKTYLVGGAVRDQLLGLPVKEKDWVVVGSTPEAMVAKGFVPVGKEFPVFLHPETKEEYALARTEKKIGKGYKGFTFYASPEVTLEQDLTRRDLTINAMAQDDHGQLVDPYHGADDIKAKLLRHVSSAFSEDPVRILRCARFASKLPHFSVATETIALMHDMVANGEVDALVAERVWKELEKSLGETDPTKFFIVLDQCGALGVLFPDIHLDSAGFKAFEKAIETTNKKTIRLACLLYDLDERALNNLCQRYKVPNEFADLAKLTVKLNNENFSDSPESLLQLFDQADAYRRPERFVDYLLVRALTNPLPMDTQVIIEALAKVQAVDTSKLQAQGLQGLAFKDALHKLRINQLHN